jgi:hypothetical protein
MSGTRKIYKGAVTSQHAVREVLTMVFAQELLAPSKEVFIVAPWISNIVVFDSQIGQYATLNPEWAKREIRLVEVLVAIAANGTTLHIHTTESSSVAFKKLSGMPVCSINCAGPIAMHCCTPKASGQTGF